MFTLECQEASKWPEKTTNPQLAQHTNTTCRFRAKCAGQHHTKYSTGLNTSPRGQTAAAMVKHFKQQVCKECFHSSNERSFLFFPKDFIGASHATVCKQTHYKKVGQKCACCAHTHCEAQEQVVFLWVDLAQFPLR